MWTLAHPAWLLLVALLPLAGWHARRTMRAGRDDGLVLVHGNLEPLTQGGGPSAPGVALPLMLEGLALALLLLALAQPRWIGDWIPEAPQGREIVLLIDTSKTMSIGDFELHGRPAERLSVLKSLVARFVRARRGDRFGVIVFASRAATLVPPTFDSGLVSGVIDRVQVGIAGDDTALGDAIGLALKQLGERPRLRPALILFSDGGDSNTGDILPREAVSLARHAGVPVYTVQIGSDLFAAGRPESPATASAEPGLEAIARLTGGRYYQAGNRSALQGVIDDIGAREPTVPRPATRRAVREWYWLPLLLAAALFSLGGLIRIGRGGV